MSVAVSVNPYSMFFTSFLHDATPLPQLVGVAGDHAGAAAHVDDLDSREHRTGQLERRDLATAEERDQLGGRGEAEIGVGHRARTFLGSNASRSPSPM